MKELKFAENLVPLVLSGEKYSTWRLFDDKEIQVGDEIDFVNAKTKKVFARASVMKVIERPMGKLKDEEVEGHEKYANDEKMYETFSKYYQEPIGPETIVKIIRFDLV